MIARAAAAVLTVLLMMVQGAGAVVLSDIPDPSAQAIAKVFLSDATNPADEDEDNGVSSAQANARIGSGDNVAEGEASVSPGAGNELRALSIAGGCCNPLVGRTRVESVARTVRHFSTAGIDPGVPFNLNVEFVLDGLLGGLSSSKAPGDPDMPTSLAMRAGVSGTVSIFDEAGQEVLVDGSAILFSTGNQLSGGAGLTEFTHQLSGDFADLNVSTTPVSDPLNIFGGNGNLGGTAKFNNQSVFIPNAVLTDFADVFAIEIELSTFVHLNGLEAMLVADFDDTVTVALTVGDDVNGNPVQGLTVVEITDVEPGPGPATPLPEPASLWLLGAGLLLSASGRMRRFAGARARGDRGRRLT